VLLKWKILYGNHSFRILGSFALSTLPKVNPSSGVCSNALAFPKDCFEKTNLFIFSFIIIPSFGVLGRTPFLKKSLGNNDLVLCLISGSIFTTVLYGLGKILF
jgi:hypothetical protein